MSSIDARAAFERLKMLAGEWEADTGRSKARVTYEVIAGGVTLVQRDQTPGHEPMLTVYHLDGDRLVLTHYCMVGNQPRMEARTFDAKTGELRFEFLDATNLANPDAGHMHNATLRLADNQRFSADWEFYETGRRKFTKSLRFTRVR